MKIYKVTSIFFDSGITRGKIESFEAEQLPESTVEETDKYDKYVDYYDDPNEALKQYNNLKKA